MKAILLILMPFLFCGCAALDELKYRSNQRTREATIDRVALAKQKEIDDAKRAETEKKRDVAMRLGVSSEEFIDAFGEPRTTASSKGRYVLYYDDGPDKAFKFFFEDNKLFAREPDYDRENQLLGIAHNREMRRLESTRLQEQEDAERRQGWMNLSNTLNQMNNDTRIKNLESNQRQPVKQVQGDNGGRVRVNMPGR